MCDCKECNKQFKRTSDLSKHIGIFHKDTKEYYDKWIKKENEGICKICGNESKFRNLTHGYNNVCNNKKCLSSFKYNNLRNGMIKKYGNYASSLIQELKEKQKNTCIIKYGSKSSLSSEKIRNKIEATNLKKYGVKNVSCNIYIRNKIEATNLKKYGVKNVFQSEEIKKKIKITNIERYGVSYYLELEKIKQQNMFNKYGVLFAQQNKDIHIKQQINSCKIKKYKNSEIYYRGSFEYDFLEKYNFLTIQNGPSIKYKYKNKIRIYHSDFMIKDLKLIIEIKNSYLAKRDKNILIAKKKAVESIGIKFIMIIDKNYTEFETLI